MARQKKEETVIEESSKSEVRTGKDILLAHFKANKQSHYNFEESHTYKVPSSSMILNMEIGGGLTPGCSRFCGTTAGGKSSAALDFLKNFLKDSNVKELRKGVYFRCEGRLSEEMKLRSGIKFVEDINLWENGTTLIVDSSEFEFVFDTIRSLIVENEEKCKYFFILDSVDMMAKKIDLERPLEDAQSVAGGALLTSVFLKKVSIALAKRGHIAIFISQVRETVKINPYDKTPPKQGNASGGHALEHAQNLVLEFLPRFGDDIIRENPSDKNSKPIGHFAKCKIVKSDNESYLREVKYPIAYGRKNGNSVWREKEVLDMLRMFDLVKKSGAWYSVDDTLIKELKDINIEIEPKFQGIDSLDTWLQNNPSAVDFLIEKLSKIT